MWPHLPILKRAGSAPNTPSYERQSHGRSHGEYCGGPCGIDRGPGRCLDDGVGRGFRQRCLRVRAASRSNTPGACSCARRPAHAPGPGRRCTASRTGTAKARSAAPAVRDRALARSAIDSDFQLSRPDRARLRQRREFRDRAAVPRTSRSPVHFCSCLDMQPNVHALYRLDFSFTRSSCTACRASTVLAFPLSTSSARRCTSVRHSEAAPASSCPSSKLRMSSWATSARSSRLNARRLERMSSLLAIALNVARSHLRRTARLDVEPKVSEESSKLIIL